jgi:hypothetical protein
METKAPFYNVVNIFLPGFVLVGSVVLLFLDDIKPFAKAITDLGSAGLETLVTVSLFAIAYETGYIVFRLGEVGVEPILKKVFGWTNYQDFIAAGKTSEKAYNKLEMLSREYGYVRTQIGLLITLSVLIGIKMYWWLMVLCLVCMVVFVLTARSHMKKIQAAVTKYLE